MLFYSRRSALFGYFINKNKSLKMAFSFSTASTPVAPEKFCAGEAEAKVFPSGYTCYGLFMLISTATMDTTKAIMEMIIETPGFLFIK